MNASIRKSANPCSMPGERQSSRHPFTSARSPNVKILPAEIMSPDVDAQDCVEGWTLPFRRIHSEVDT